MIARSILLVALVWWLGFTALAQGAVPCDTIKTFADGKSPQRTLFVSPSGSNADGDGSRARPYQSVARALQGVRPGDAVRLLPGEHRGGISIENVHGTAEAPVWIGGEEGAERPVIRGGASAIMLRKVRYLVLENLEITGATGNGINCDDGAEYTNTHATQFVLFRKLFIHAIGTGRNNDGLKLSGVNDFMVLDCEFSRVSENGSGIDHVGCHRGLVARTKFIGGGNAVQCKGGSEDIEIRWNHFDRPNGRGVNVGGSTGFAFFRPPLRKDGLNFEARNIRVFANLFEGAQSPVAFVGAVDCVVANNTIINPTRWALRILQETTSKDGFEFPACGTNEFSNNIVWFQRSQASIPVNIGANTAPETFRFANNLWYAHDAPQRSDPGLPARESNAIVGQNPMFVSETNYDLRPESPAVAKGKRVGTLRADLLGRCYADQPSIGAFEANRPAR